MPNLVETVKGYSKHENGTLEKITALRSEYNNKNHMDIKSANKMNNELTKYLAVVEAYPELKADTVIYTFKIYEKDAKITKEQSRKVKDQLCVNPTVKTVALAAFKVRSIYTGLDDKEVTSVTVDTKACGF